MKGALGDQAGYKLTLRQTARDERGPSWRREEIRLCFSNILVDQAGLEHDEFRARLEDAVANTARCFNGGQGQTDLVIHGADSFHGRPDRIAIDLAWQPRALLIKPGDHGHSRAVIDTLLCLMEECRQAAEQPRFQAIQALQAVR